MLDLYYHSGLITTVKNLNHSIENGLTGIGWIKKIKKISDAFKRFVKTQEAIFVIDILPHRSFTKLGIYDNLIEKVLKLLRRLTKWPNFRDASEYRYAFKYVFDWDK